MQGEKQHIIDIRMLELIEILKLKGEIRYTQEFIDTIGMHKQNLRKIKLGTLHFTADQVYKSVTTYKVNGNWIFGLDKKIFLNADNISPHIRKTLPRKKVK